MYLLDSEPRKTFCPRCYGVRMSDATKKARDRLDEVIKKGEQVLTTARKGPVGHYLEDSQGYTQWRMSARTSLNALDSQGHFTADFERIDFDPNAWVDKPTKLSDQLGVVKALRDDFDGGHLLSIRGLVRGEVFRDFLEQGQHLLDQGYWQPVAVIVGAVLEDHLRKLCSKHPTIALPAKPKLDWMNAELAKAGQYNVLRQKQVTFWADIRNKAAHGEWQNLKPADIETMLREVPGFLADNPL